MDINCNNENEIIDNVKNLLKNKKLQNEMIKNQSKIINKNSAKDIVELIKNFDKLDFYFSSLRLGFQAMFQISWFCL